SWQSLASFFSWHLPGLTRQSWPRAAAEVVAAVAAVAAEVAAVSAEVEAVFAVAAVALVLLPVQGVSAVHRAWAVSAVRRAWAAAVAAHRCLQVFDLPSVEWPVAAPSAQRAG